MLNSDLIETIEAAKESLLKNEEGRLLYSHRKQIWQNFGSLKKDAPNYEVAHMRRFNLALSCVLYVLPIWEREFSSYKNVGDLIDLAKKAINGGVEKSVAEKTAYNEWSFFDSLETETENEMRAVSVGYASVNTVYVAARDEIFHEVLKDELDEDPYMWDTAFHTFLAYTGFGGENSEGIEKNREFWLWYLDIAVPQSYELAS